MSVPIRDRSISAPVKGRLVSAPVKGRSIRALAAVTVLKVVASTVLMIVVAACGGTPAGPIAPPARPGQPAGTVVLQAGNDIAQAVQRLQDAVVAGGGVVTAVVDHAADARATGVETAPNTVVVGGTSAAQVPLMRADQRAAANLPQRYLVRQAGDGSVTVTYDGADYVAAVSMVTAPDARTALRDTTAAVAGVVAPSAGPPIASPLVGVTPVNYLLTVFGSTNVPATVNRLVRNTNRGASRSVAVVDMAAGSADPGPAVRPTSLVLVSTPAAEAPLIAAAPSIGLEFPMRFVVWLDDQNRTQIGYPDVRRLAARHGVAADDPNVAQLAADANRLAKLAAGTAA